MCARVPARLKETPPLTSKERPYSQSVNFKVPAVFEDRAAAPWTDFVVLNSVSVANDDSVTEWRAATVLFDFVNCFYFYLMHSCRRPTYCTHTFNVF